MNKREIIETVRELADSYRDSADLHYMEARDDTGSYGEEMEYANDCAKYAEALYTIIKLVER